MENQERNQHDEQAKKELGSEGTSEDKIPDIKDSSEIKSILKDESKEESQKEESQEDTEELEISNKKLFAILAVFGLIVAGGLFYYFRDGSATGNVPSQPVAPVASPVKNTAPNNAPDQNAQATIRLEIDENLILEKALEQGINITEKDIDAFIRQNLVASQMTEEQLIEEVRKNGLGYEQYKEELRYRLILAQLINKNLDLESVNVTENEVDDFISLYSEQFKEFMNDENALRDLKSSIRAKLIQDKKNEIVAEYIRKEFSLQSNNGSIQK